MQVTVMIVWSLKEDKSQDCYRMISDLRASAMRQTNYISSETLQDHNNPARVIVFSKWKDIDSWHAWLDSQERKSLTAQAEKCFAHPPEYQVFTVLRLREKLRG
jgi:heme-degrading monooxygenase HmoA